MKPKIVSREKTILVGISIFGNLFKGNKIPQLWDKFNPYIKTIKNRVNPNEFFGLEYYPDSFGKIKEWHYMAAVQVKNATNIPLELICKVLPRSQYAVFKHKGPLTDLPKTFRYAYDQYLPNSKYHITFPYDFELYYKGPQNVSIYIPVKEKTAISYNRLRYESVENPNVADVNIISSGLDLYNRSVIGKKDWSQLASFVKNEKDEILGGVIGVIEFDWLFITIFWVDKNIRKKGVGTRLLKDIEKLARSRKIRNIHLCTGDFQALEFYKKNGYEIYGKLNDKPKGHVLYYLKKEKVR